MSLEAKKLISRVSRGMSFKHSVIEGLKPEELCA
jgi:hypothetical protein